MKAILTARDLAVNYEQHMALQIDDLCIAGNTIALIGHNGAGKSTLIKTVLQLLNPKRGTVEVSLQGAKKALEPSQHMSFCPETGSVFDDIKVEDYIKLWCRTKTSRASYYKKEGSWIMEALSISPLLRRLGRELSKGQKRRIQTAIGFLCRPKLFLFDEPFDGLDVQRTSELLEVMRLQAHETAYFISSHRMDVVERVADAVIVLQEGRILVAGKAQFVSDFLYNGSANSNQPVECSSLTDAMHHYLSRLRGSGNTVGQSKETWA